MSTFHLSVLRCWNDKAFAEIPLCTFKIKTRRKWKPNNTSVTDGRAIRGLTWPAGSSDRDQINVSAHF